MERIALVTGSTNNIGKAIADSFIVSDKAKYIIGAILSVDGGLNISL